MANKKVFYTLLVCFFLVMTGYGIVLPILPGFIQEIARNGNYGYFSVPIHVGLITGIFPLMQFFFAPVWGKHSDIAGRYGVLMIGMSGYAVSLMLFGLVENLLLLYLFRILGGIFSASVIPIVNSCITDLTTREQRGRALSIAGGAGSLGVVVGPVISSFIAGSHLSLELVTGNPFTLLFVLAGLLSLIAALVLYIFHDNMGTGVKISAASVSSSRISFNNKPRNGYDYSTLMIIGLAVMVAGILSMFATTFSLHAGKTLGYGPYMMGFVFMICGLVMSMGQAGIAGLLIDRWGEVSLVQGSFLLISIALLLLMLVSDFVEVALAVSLMASGIALINPALTSLISKKSTFDVGRRMGQLAGMSSMGLALGSFGGAGLYSMNIHLPYLLFSILSGVTFLFMLWYKKYLMTDVKNP